MAKFDFFVREADSDVTNQRVLGDYASGIQIQLDSVLAAGAALATVQTFLTPKPLPGKAKWEAGAYTLTLEVAGATSVSYTAQLWRADKTGADVAQVGAQPAVQTGAGTKTLGFTGAEQASAVDDRLKLKVLARNDDGASAQTFSMKCSASKLATPIEQSRSREAGRSRFRRGRFLGVIPRHGEGRSPGDFGKGGVPL